MLEFEKKLIARTLNLDDISELKSIADNESPRACYDYAYINYYGIVISQNRDEALKYFEIASEKGNYEILFSIARIYLNDREDLKKQAFKLLAKARTETDELDEEDIEFDRLMCPLIDFKLLAKDYIKN